jgi:hypothetical protein
MGRQHRNSKASRAKRVRARRPRWLWPVVMAVALVGGAIGWLVFPTRSPLADAPRYQGGARLAVDTALIDFGDVRFEKLVQARFRLRNVGDQPLQLAANPPVEVVEGC